METAELGHQTVEFSSLVRRATEESYLALKELVEKSKKGDEHGQQLSDSEKKIDLLKFIARTRQRMLRLHVLAKWCQQVPLVDYCRQLASTLSTHETCFTQTADSLFFVHEELQQARAPMFDVPSAIEVFLTGGYNRLPNCIDDLGIQSMLPEVEQKPALKKLNTLVRSKLLEVVIPKEVSDISVSDGITTFRVDGEFKVFLTLGYRGHLHLWRILHLELLVGEKTGPIKLEEIRQFALGDDIERRMAVSENPFNILYTILHELCVALLMDTVIRQAQMLRHGRWRDAIRFELISDSHLGQTGNTAVMQLGQDGELDSTGLRIPGLKITYWLDIDKSSALGTESESSPYVKIEPGQDLHVRCVHSSFILDPLTDKEATLTIDQTCIDVEKLLLRAIACNRHTRLLEIQRELSRNVQICRASGDVVLKHEGLRVDTDRQKKEDKLSTEDYYRDEVLQVRAYGNSYINLGVNIRTGHFLLHSSKNILPQSAISESEEALNKGSVTATDAFVSLRSKSILHLFANTGKFLGLKVYDQTLNTLTVPKSEILGSDISIMGFPQCGNMYYLSVQLDKDFKPVFHLLETQPNLGEKNNSIADGKQVTRCSKIDIGQMHTTQNELNTSLTDWERMSMLQSVGAGNKTKENVLETVLQLPGGSRSTFSSIVDEVFEKTNAPGSFSSQNNLPASFSLPSFSHLEGGLQHSSAHISSSGYLQNSGLQSSNTFATSSPLRNSLGRQVVPSKSDQDLRSAHLPDIRQNSSFVGSTTNIKKTTSAITQPQQMEYADFPSTSGHESTPQEKTARKRSVSEVVLHIPSLRGLKAIEGRAKRRKVSEPVNTYLPDSQPLSSAQPSRTSKVSYGSLLSERNHGISANIYCSVLLHVMRHCSLCIKHAQLTNQMDSLDISYVEEVGLRALSSSLWLRLPFARDNSWKHICLRLGKSGSMCWDVKINDQHFRELRELNKGCTVTPWGPGVRFANTSETDSHISFDSDGVLLAYKTVEADSVKNLVSDLRRILNARSFACGMRRLIGLRPDDKNDEEVKEHSGELVERLSEVRKAFKIEAVGLMSLWFSFGSMPSAGSMHGVGSMPSVHFVVEWEAGKEGCTMHVSPDQLWPHTKFLEDFVNGGEVASFLDCIRLTAGPLLSLSGAIRPARMPVTVSTAHNPLPKHTSAAPSQGNLSNSSPNVSHPPSAAHASTCISQLANHNLHAAAMLSATGRERPGIVPSSLLPFDVSVVLRGPYWIRIIYRKKFSVDMRCFAGDQVWLQPATPPKGGPSAGGSLPCPQFRPFIMEHVAQGLSTLEPNFVPGSGNSNHNTGQQQVLVGPSRINMAPGGITRLGSGPASQGQVPSGVARAANAAVLAASSGLGGGITGVPLRLSQGGLPVHMKGELNTAFIGLGDDGGYGGGWVPLAALKKVLRGILKYLGVLWLFAQLPELLKEILGSILKDNEGALLNLDQEQPALRFYVGGYVFAVSVHRVQLLLQVLSVKRFHHQQQLAQAQAHQTNTQEELTPSEINEICEYFSRRVASEPYDASRVASFITLLTLPISALREFLKLIAWKKGLLQVHGGDIATAQRGRIELCLENHSGYAASDNGSVSKSNIRHDRAHNLADFALTFVLDPAHIPHMNVAGGAAWLPYCVSVRLRYSFGEGSHNHANHSYHVSFLGMDGSHGGRACWLQYEDWEKCKQRVAHTVERSSAGSMGDVSQGRLRLVAENVQKTLQTSLQQMRDGPISAGSVAN